MMRNCRKGEIHGGNDDVVNVNGGDVVLEL